MGLAGRKFVLITLPGMIVEKYMNLSRWHTRENEVRSPAGKEQEVKR